MANKKMTALCMAAMLAASLGSVASASESGITFPLEESYSFSIMTRAGMIPSRISARKHWFREWKQLPMCR